MKGPFILHSALFLINILHSPASQAKLPQLYWFLPETKQNLQHVTCSHFLSPAGFCLSVKPEAQESHFYPSSKLAFKVRGQSEPKADARVSPLLYVFQRERPSLPVLYLQTLLIMEVKVNEIGKGASPKNCFP